MAKDDPRKMMPMSDLREMTEEMNPDDFEVGDSPIDITPIFERDGDNFSPDDDRVLLKRAARSDLYTVKPDPEAEG